MVGDNFIYQKITEIEDGTPS